jgi:hypothetical protein
MTVSMIVGTLGTSVRHCSGPAELLGEVNRSLIGRSDGFATCLALMYREFPRLCRGGSSSLTFPGVHPETLRGEPPSTHQGETGWTSMKA